MSGRATLMLPLPALTACTGVPAVLDPGGANADAIAALARLLFVAGGVIFAMVVVLAAWSVLAPAAMRAWLAESRFVVGAGIAFPVVTLTALLAHTLVATGARSDSTGALRIEVTGEMWWWRVRYLDGDGGTLLETANEIHVPTGRPIELRLATADVLHSFWVPRLAGKLDMVPGRVNVLHLAARTPGVYRGQCAEYCGLQHARMAFAIIAQPAADFDAWLAAQLRPVAPPADAAAERAVALFVAQCAMCHRVRGTPAAGALGPDLTHVGSRRRLVAGTLPNNVGTLAGWIASSQDLKPGSRMPSFGHLPGDELLNLAAWLGSLE
jgi:cytochrome c oxidase subunit 2